MHLKQIRCDRGSNGTRRHAYRCRFIRNRWCLSTVITSSCLTSLKQLGFGPLWARSVAVAHVTLIADGVQQVHGRNQCNVYGGTVGADVRSAFDQYQLNENQPNNPWDARKADHKA